MFHQTIVVGRVGANPEVRYTTSGQAVANLSLAVTEKYKEKETTTWYRVQLWGKLAELAGEYVTKGMMLLIEGRMNTREYEKDGVKRESWELIANVMKFLSSKKEGTSHSDGAHVNSSGGGPVVDDDDIPFN